jgi:hypothetical protein
LPPAQHPERASSPGPLLSRSLLALAKPLRICATATCRRSSMSRSALRRAPKSPLRQIVQNQHLQKCSKIKAFKSSRICVYRKIRGERHILFTNNPQLIRALDCQPLLPRRSARITASQEAGSLRSPGTDCPTLSCRPDPCPRQERGALRAACATSPRGWPCLR